MLTRSFAAATVASLFFYGALASATPITLSGVSGSGITATVTNDTLIGNQFSFDLENTSSGFITNVGVAVGNIVGATGFSTTSPFSYFVIDDPSAPPEFPFGPAVDFALLESNPQVAGINAGQTFHFSFALVGDDGAPLPTLTADQLAMGLQVRFRGLSTPSGTDLAVATVPEPATLTLVGLGLVAIARRSRRRSK